MRPIAVALDCDGVILDSNEMKCAAFRDALAAYPSAATQPFLVFQRTAFGTSRYRLFDIFFHNYLGRSPEAGERDGLLDSFASICREAYPRQSFTLGAVETIVALHKSGHRLWVVSGSDETELRHALSSLGVARHFVEVLGSPTSKARILSNLKAVATEGLAFVGDAEADFLASEACGLPFVGMLTYSAAPKVLAALHAQHGFPMIDALHGLPAALDHLQAAIRPTQ